MKLSLDNGDSVESVEIVSTGYKVEEAEKEPVYPDCEKEVEYMCTGK